MVLNSSNEPALTVQTRGTGKDLVFLHGWGMNSGAFSQFLPYLQDDFTITTIDLPGFGNNHHLVPHPYSVASIADMLVNQLPHNCVLAGWSLGGLIAQHLALHAPEKVCGMITIASSPKFVAAPGWPGIAPQLLGEFESHLSEDYKKTLDRFLAIQAMGSPSARKDIKAIKDSINRFPAPAMQALEAGLGLLSKEDLRQQIGRIRQPTLRLYGRLDSLIPISGVDMICQLHPSADTVVLPHAAHAPFISHPQQTADIIRQFMTGLD